MTVSHLYLSRYQIIDVVDCHLHFKILYLQQQLYLILATFCRFCTRSGKLKYFHHKIQAVYIFPSNP